MFDCCVSLRLKILEDDKINSKLETDLSLTNALMLLDAARRESEMVHSKTLNIKKDPNFFNHAPLDFLKQFLTQIVEHFYVVFSKSNDFYKPEDKIYAFQVGKFFSSKNYSH